MINDCKLAKLRELTGQTGGHIDDLEWLWLESTGVAKGHVNDMWMAYLAAQGFATGSLNDRKFLWLRSLGYTGHIDDMEAEMWCGDGPGGGGPPAAFHALAPDNQGVMQGVLTGTGGLTTTHADEEIYAPDVNGVYQQFSNNTPVWSGGNATLSAGPGSPVTEYRTAGGEHPYLVYQPQATNKLFYSRDFANLGSLVGGATIAADQPGIDGTPNGATTLTVSTTGDSYLSVLQANAPAADSNTSTLKVWNKKDDNNGSADNRKGMLWGADGNNLYLLWNSQTGEIDESQSPTGTYEIVDAGDWWLILWSKTHTTTPGGTTLLRLDSNRVPYGTAGTGVWGQVEWHQNKTIAEVRGLGPIFTTTAEASTDATVYRFDAANYHETQSAKYFEQIAPETGTCFEAAFSTFDYVTSWNAAERFFYFNGSNRSSLQSTDRVPYTPTKCGVSFHADTSEAGISVNGGAWAEGQNFVSVNLGSPGVGVNGNRPCQVRNLRRYDITSFQEGKDIIDGLMT